jgi:hypothetical protein
MVAIRRLRIYKLGSGLENSFVNCTESVRKGDSVGILGCEIKFVGPESP